MGNWELKRNKAKKICLLFNISDFKTLLPFSLSPVLPQTKCDRKICLYGPLKLGINTWMMGMFSFAKLD